MIYDEYSFARRFTEDCDHPVRLLLISSSAKMIIMDMKMIVVGWYRFFKARTANAPSAVEHLR